LVSLVCVHYRCISSKYSEHCLSTCSRRWQPFFVYKWTVSHIFRTFNKGHGNNQYWR
jgi:hypothetical protein